MRVADLFALAAQIFDFLRAASACFGTPLLAATHASANAASRSGEGRVPLRPQRLHQLHRPANPFFQTGKRIFFRSAGSTHIEAYAFSSAALAWFTSALNAGGSFSAMSARILRFRSTPAFFSPSMNRL